MVKYLMVHNQTTVAMYRGCHDQIAMTGLLAWPRAMDGDVAALHDPRIRHAEILHVNLAKTNLHYPRTLRHINPRARIVAVLDYAPELLHGNEITPHSLADACAAADLVVATSSHQRDWTRAFLGEEGDIHIELLPHPVDTTALSAIGKNIRREYSVALFVHRYVSRVWNTIPVTALANLLRQRDETLWVEVYGLSERPYMLSDDIVYHTYTSYPIFLYSIARHRVLVDLHRFMACGRLQMVAGGLRRWCVGPRWLDMQQALYPDFGVDGMSLLEWVERVETALHTPSSRLRSVHKKLVGLAGLEASKQRLLDLLGGVG